MKLLGNEWISNLLKPKLGMIRKPGRYNLILDKRFGFIILVGKRGESPSYRVVGKAHILLLENLMMWFTVFVGQTKAKIKLFTRID